MCYFTKKVLNKRFLPNRKNRWNPPVCTDERFRYVEVECGGVRHSAVQRYGVGVDRRVGGSVACGDGDGVGDE